MNLSCLIYKSISTTDVVSNRTMRSLEDQAATANTASGITGLLVLAGNVFVQILEGGAQEITALFGNIVADKRHREVELVTFHAIAERHFDDWAMRLVDLYDLPGEKRALMAAKYHGKNGDIAVPDDAYRLHAFLLDAKYLCDSAPWKKVDRVDEPASSA